MTRRRSKVVAARRVNHKIGVFLGDVRAVQTGRIPERIINRIIGRMVGKAMRGVWR